MYMIDSRNNALVKSLYLGVVYIDRLDYAQYVIEVDVQSLFFCGTALILQYYGVKAPNDAFYRLMVEVMKLQRQKKCIRAAGKSSALRWKTSGSFFSSSELFLFLDQTFLFLDLDCLTSLRSVRQLSDLEKKSLISEKKKFPLGKETSPSNFSSSEQSLSSSTEHIFRVVDKFSIFTVFMSNSESLHNGRSSN